MPLPFLFTPPHGLFMPLIYSLLPLFLLLLILTACACEIHHIRAMLRNRRLKKRVKISLTPLSEIYMQNARYNLTANKRVL